MGTTAFQREWCMTRRQAEAGATRVRTAAEARNRRIPLRKQKYGPAGPDPNECFPQARRAGDATLQDDDVVATDAPVATALPSTAPARLDAPPLEVLFEYMWDAGI